MLYRGKNYVPPHSDLKLLLIEEFHATPIGGHAGILKTFGRLSKNFYWSRMTKDVVEFVSKCLACQQTKVPTHSPYGLLHPLPIPIGIWEAVSADFIVGLLSFQNYTVILVVVDKLSKAAHFGMLRSSFNAAQVAQLFVEMVCKLPGMPKSILSNRDPIFMSQFWRELFNLSGTKLRMTIAYHPQGDGQAEVVNRILQQYLRAFVHHQPSR